MFTAEELAKRAATIGKLLAKAERTDNEWEAEAFREQAERMMLRFGIEEAMARQASGGEVKPEKIVTLRITPPVPGSYRRSHVEMMHSVARALDLSGFRDHNWQWYTVIGHESDVARYEQLVHSLSLQVAGSMKAWWKGSRADHLHLSANDQFLARYSFVIAFGNVVGSRLRKFNQEEQAAVAGSSLVLRDRKKEVEEFFESLGTKSRQQKDLFRGNAAGAEAGRNANLGEKSVGGRKALG